MTLRFHVGSQDMQSKVHCPVMIVVAGYLITIALEELLYLNRSPDRPENGRLQQTLVLRLYLVEWRSQSSTCPLTIISLSPDHLKPTLNLSLAGQPLAFYCTFSLDRRNPVTFFCLSR